MLERGNHKSALTPDHTIVLEKIQRKEVSQGFTFPLTIDCLRKMKGAAVIPMGVHDQWTINEEGERFLKPRACHDASFPTPSGYSVNLDHNFDLLSPCIYGQCLQRCLYSIHKMRITYPLVSIYLTKYDFDAAYRRVHVCPVHAVKTMIVIGELAYLLSRLPFGVECGPSEYSSISEGIFDLANDLLDDPKWDPEIDHSPLKSELSVKNISDRTIPYSEAKELCVDIPFRKATCDGYIDDAILIALDIEKNVTRSQNSIQLATHCIFRPLSKNEPISRNDTVSKRKLEGEGTPDEIKPVLGWIIDTRLFRIFLPTDKAFYWISDLKLLLQEKYQVKSKEIESYIGRLNHVGYIMPHGRFFLNRFRRLLMRCQKYGPQFLSQMEKNDDKLWIKMLTKASQLGVSINQITFVKHDEVIYTDACETGLGGYNPRTGKGWRYRLPVSMQKQFHINILEFIASLIGIWLEVKNKNIELLSILAKTDNSSAVGWLVKSNFDPDSQSKHDLVARQLAEVLLESETTLHPEHVQGAHNIIADSLSRDLHIPVKKHAFILCELYPTQTPMGLSIEEDLPADITCWLASLKGGKLNGAASPLVPTPSKMGTLVNGGDSWPVVASSIRSWKDIANRPSSAWSAPLQLLCEEMNMAREILLDFQAKPLNKPLITFVRPLGQTFTAAPSLNQAECHHS